MNKRVLSILLVLVLIFALTPAAFAASAAESAAADKLYTLGVLRGTDGGFELDRNATRQEALITVIRLLGREETALSGAYASSFTDVPALTDSVLAPVLTRHGVVGSALRSVGVQPLPPPDALPIGAQTTGL